ncbi:dienelactone hydrolase family protein [Acinetobacter sp. ANC 4633]|uniref:dienelactone hydrolase family protein n=1 Tax=Acinetobacter sp. ANC 4633 TaxID=2529845 RepID=UPI0013F16CD5|nr:dienelactone hydrolase family protein [Acinetobacter sp. ANC 4633]
MSIYTQAIEYQYQNQQLKGYLVYPTPYIQPSAGLLMAPNWMGIKPSDIDIANEVAAQGYCVFLLDLYGKNRRPKDATQAGEWVSHIKNTEHEVGLLAAAHQALLQQTYCKLDPQHIAAFGFCLGGHNVLEYARSGAEIQAAISFHGSLDSSGLYRMQQFKGSVLVLDGACDPLVPREQLQEFSEEMKETELDWQLISYGQTYHSFTEKTANEAGIKQYNEKSSKRAFQSMYELLEDVFQ